MKNNKNLSKILDTLQELYGDVDCALHHKTPFQLMVATILSAQCTDERVNKVTPALFNKYPTPKELASVSQSTLEKMIRSTGFYRQKAKWIRGNSQILLKKFNGQVPQTMEQLLTLPGVARKTANVVLATAFGKAEGIVVDTHVKRLSKRLGLTQQTDPIKVEKDLVQQLSQEHWIWWSHALIHHGRGICKAIHPLCEKCLLSNLCPSSPF